MSGETLTANDSAGQQLSGAAGDDVLYAGHNSVVLTGNAGADDFVFQYLPWNAGQVTDFTAGTDRLDLSSLLKASGYAGSDPVADGYVILQADGSGGTEVLYDTDGRASGNTLQFRITDLQHVSQTGLTWAQLSTGAGGPSGGGPSGGGPSGGGPSAGGSGGVTLTGGDSPQTLTGGAGDDTITAGHSSDTITTSAGHDLVVFKYSPWNASTVTDFTVGEDKADFSQLLASVGYSGSDPVRDGYLSLVAGGSGDTKVMLDKDATGATLQVPITVTELHGVDPHLVTYAQLTDPASVATTLAFTGGANGATVGPSEVAALPFTVTRSGPTDGTTTAHWSVAPAQDGNFPADPADFQGGVFPSGDLTFAPGETSKTIVVNVVGDPTPEQDEAFFVQLSNITGGTMNSPPGEGIISSPGSPGRGGSAGVVLTASKPGDTLVGGPGTDTLNASQGPDTLTGNGAPDHFVFASLPWHAGEVTDFAPGGDDALDLSALVTASHYAGSNPIADGYLILRPDGQGDTQVYWDSDGPSGAKYPTLITTLDHVAPSSLWTGNFIFH